MDAHTPSPSQPTPGPPPDEAAYHLLAREFVAAMNADDASADEAQHVLQFVEAWNDLVRSDHRPETIITMLAALVGTDDEEDVSLSELTDDVVYFLSRVSADERGDAAQVEEES